MIPEEPLAPPVPSGPGRPTSRVKKEDLLQMAIEGGLPAIRGLLYEMTKWQLRGKKIPQEHVDTWYLRAKVLGVLADVEDAGVRGIYKEIEKIKAKLEPSLTAVEPVTIEPKKPKFTEEH